jgi:hypothetical protein
VFLIGVALTRVSLPVAMAPPLVTAYLAPALMTIVGDRSRGDPLIWLALLGGVVIAASDWSRWRTPRSWTPWLAGWSMLLALTWPIVAGREIDFSLIAARTLDTPNGLRAGPPPLAAAAVTGSVLGHLIGILWLDLLWARFGRDRAARAERCVIVPLAVSALLVSIAGLYQHYADPAWLHVPVWLETGRAGSLMLDANAFGMAAAIWAPLTLVLAENLRRPFRCGVLACAVLAGGMWVSGSRTALLVALAGVGAWLTARTRLTPGIRPGVVAGFAAALVVLAVAAVAVSDGTNPVARLADGWRATGGFASSIADYLWNRYGYGPAAMRAIGEHPVAGVGTGGFSYLSSDYAYLSSGAIIPPDNAQNWWRHQVAELGFVGSVWSIGFSCVVLATALRSPARTTSAVTATAVRAIVIAIGVVSLVGVPTQHPAIWVTFATLVYWLGAVTSPRAAGLESRAQAPLALAAAIVAVSSIVVVAQVSTARGDLRVPHRARQIGFPYAYGFSAPDADGAPWMTSHAVAVVPVQHAYFAITMETPDLGSAARMRLWRDGRLIVDEEVRRESRVSRLLRIPDGQKHVMIEGELSPAASAGRGVKFDGRWLRELPPGTPAAEVVD